MSGCAGFFRFCQVALGVVLTPTVVYAHDAFGELGPFYASMLHPLADPLQASMLVGAAAFLASRPIVFVRLALPLFAAAAIVATLVVASKPSFTFPVIVTAVTVLIVGLATILPEKFVPVPLGLGIIGTAGTITGLVAGIPDGEFALQYVLGTALGISGLAVLAWFWLDTVSRQFTSLIPKVAGSWVAAFGILVGAFLL